jgi:uncharacterized phiE125 gp8 family phage protein
MSLNVITYPELADIPVQLAEMKEHLRIDHDDEDDEITNMMLDAYSWIEAEANICISPTVYEWKGSCLDYPFVFPVGPLMFESDVELFYYDTDNVEQELFINDDFYLMVSSTGPAKLWLKESVTTYDRPDAWRLSFAAGNEASLVPDQVKRLMKLLTAHFYENREAESDRNTKPLALGVDRLLAQIRNWRYV